MCSLRIGQVGISVDGVRRTCCVEYASSIHANAAATLYTTLVSAYLSYLDNLAPLHGSCVSRDGNALCIAGRAGAGKSTLAAALVARGAKFVSDGVTIVDPDSALAQPGPATRRLWDDAIRWLGDDPEKYPPLEVGPPKRVCPVPEGDLVQDPPKLQKIFIVEDSEALDIERLGPQESVIELIRHGFLSPWLDVKEAPKLTQLSAAVARLVPVFRLRRPKQLDALEATVALLDCQFG